MPPDLDDNFAGGDERDACDRCGGAGGYHDCGEDTCPCADPGGPDDPDWITCEDCGGSGHAN